MQQNYFIEQTFGTFIDQKLSAKNCSQFSDSFSIAIKLSRETGTNPTGNNNNKYWSNYMYCCANKDTGGFTSNT